MPLATRADYEQIRRAEQRERDREEWDSARKKQLRELDRLAHRRAKELAQRQSESEQMLADAEQELAKHRADLQRVEKLLSRLEAVDGFPLISEAMRSRLRENLYKEYFHGLAPK